jgi:hypothetical protein
MVLKNLLEEYRKGLDGEATLLFHKKRHEGKNFICMRGIAENCENPFNCPLNYYDKEGCFCLEDGQTAIGVLHYEEKHRKLVELGKSGAYSSIAHAVRSML